MSQTRRFFAALVLLMLTLSGCMANGTEPSAESNWMDVDSEDKPKIPEKLDVNENGVPMLSVYDLSTEKIEEMDLETYLEGVVAGEMKNDWPLEAMKAQAILARTFVLKFCETKQSKYEGADISTDVSEAQAYAPENINDRVRQAVKETSGVVMSDDGDYPYAWFFAHAGGKTELPSVALDYQDEDPDYLEVVDSPDSEKAPDDVKQWSAEFTKDQVRQACADAGLKVGEIERVEIGERGESGRAKTLVVNGESVSAPSFRIQIGANKLKSTLIDEIKVSENSVVFSGKGFGHGVGMSQWGAYALAEEGRKAEEIVRYYFDDIDVMKIW